MKEKIYNQNAQFVVQPHCKTNMEMENVNIVVGNLVKMRECLNKNWV